MLRKSIISALVLYFLVWSVCAFAARPEASDEMLESLADEQQSQQMSDMNRSINDLERRVNRIEDRYEKLDRDLQELKRKV